KECGAESRRGLECMGGRLSLGGRECWKNTGSPAGGGAGKLEQPAIARACPEPALMVFEQVVKIVVRQTVAFGVTRHAPVRPASIQAAVRGNPQRATSVFQ